jgi:hypothetical protein
MVMGLSRNARMQHIAYQVVYKVPALITAVICVLCILIKNEAKTIGVATLSNGLGSRAFNTDHLISVKLAINLLVRYIITSVIDKQRQQVTFTQSFIFVTTISTYTVEQVFEYHHRFYQISSCCIATVR